MLEHPVPVTNLLLAPAERADVVIDFSSSAGVEIVMRNGAASPFPQGKLPTPKTTGVVMQFRVKKHLSSLDHSNVPQNLSTYHGMNPVQSNNERNLLLSMRPDEYGRSIHLLNNELWTDPITEKPRLGDV